MNILNCNISTPATQNTDEFHRCNVDMKEARHRRVHTVRHPSSKIPENVN